MRNIFILAVAFIAFLVEPAVGQSRRHRPDESARVPQQCVDRARTCRIGCLAEIPWGSATTGARARERAECFARCTEGRSRCVREVLLFREIPGQTVPDARERFRPSVPPRPPSPMEKPPGPGLLESDQSFPSQGTGTGGKRGGAGKLN